MTETTTHTIHEALDRFDLVAGAGDGKSTACVMTAISWVAGEAWTDSPQCAHRLLRAMTIVANDHPDTTPGQRAELVRAGADGLIDTWWVPDSVVLGCLAESRHDDPVAETLATLALVSWWKLDKRRANLYRADLSGANLYGANLSGANHSESTRWPDRFDKGRLA